VIPHRKDDYYLFNDDENKVKTLANGQQIKIIKKLDLVKVEEDLKEIYEKYKIKNVAVLLMHSYLFNDHEIEIGRLAQKIGFTNISLSHQIGSMIRAVPRGLTTCIDAYLTPCIETYLNSFRASFSSNVNVLFMQSDGGLTSIDNFRGSKAILSGPAGGVVGYALTTYNKEDRIAVIGFDMGGTSTDVSRYDGNYEHVFETLTAGYLIQTPQLVCLEEFFRFFFLNVFI
jgi:5-oxoprolinase (ATP-hydrolysing)